MNKQDFLDGLRRNLSSINDYNFINDTIAYYENYIESQMRMGKLEEEVMQQLGDPRLIAKSIKATYASEGAEETNGYQGFEQEGNTTRRRFVNSTFNFNGKQIRMPSWLLKAIVIIVLLVAFFIVFTVLRWLAPFIFMGVVAYAVYRTFFGKY